MYLLDTNILIFAVRHPDGACAKRLSEHVGKDVYISVVTYSELLYGVLHSSYPEKNRRALNMILAGIPILDFDLSAGEEYGMILSELAIKKIDRNQNVRDHMIAAHARAKSFTLITDNIKDFQDIDGLQIENWS